MKLMKFLLVLAACVIAGQASAAISVRDDAGNMVVLPRPAQRVVTLAPHATEMVFAAGGGDRIVGTVGYSDFPPAARDIRRIGNHRQIDIERIIALKPDLLIVWLHGNSERQLEHIRKLGIPFYYSEPHKLDDIPNSVLRIGQLLGTETQAQQTAAGQRRQLATLSEQFGNRPPVRVFYQVWGRPLYTLNGEHILTDVIRLCGGENIFAKLPTTAPTVSTESVLMENPEVIITGDRRDKTKAGLEIWESYSTMLAVRRGNLFAIDADLLNRAGPRLIAGAAAVCEKLEQARSRRSERK
jgi:iron complex transport system substrate-binding protein